MSKDFIKCMPHKPVVYWGQKAGKRTSFSLTMEDLLELCQANGLVVLPKDHFICGHCGGVRTSEFCKTCTEVPISEEIKRCGKCSAFYPKDEECLVCELEKQLEKVWEPSAVDSAVLRTNLASAKRFIEEAEGLIPDGPA